VSGETNGRIKLTWPQAVWSVAMLGTVLGAWFSLGNKLDLLRAEVLELRADITNIAKLEHEHSLLPGHAGVLERVAAVEKRIDRIEPTRRGGP
jgi:hypothetical protein